MVVGGGGLAVSNNKRMIGKVTERKISREIKIDHA
jgi:hypothetical protein